MPRFTDLAGLLGAALATASALLCLPWIARHRRSRPGPLLLAALAAALVPLGSLPAAGYLRGIVGDLSVTSVVLLLLGLLRPVVAGAEGDARSRLALQALVAAFGLVLYPASLGLGQVDPYQLGYGDPWFLGVLLALALAAAARRMTLVTGCLALAVLAWALGVYESRNLWDYLVDPLVAAWGTGAVLLRVARAKRLPRARRDQGDARGAMR